MNIRKKEIEVKEELANTIIEEYNNKPKTVEDEETTRKNVSIKINNEAENMLQLGKLYKLDL